MHDLDGAKIPYGFISLVTLLRALASFSRTAAVTGKLEVRLMGCQDLIEDVPGQHTTHTYQMPPTPLALLDTKIPFSSTVFQILIQTDIKTFKKERNSVPAEKNIFFDQKLQLTYP
jgi:hypothetical protein